MTRQWTCPDSRTPALLRQCTGCVRARVRVILPSVQKSGIRFLWQFFVHSAVLTRITPGACGVYTLRTLAHPCTHVCVQGVYTRVYDSFPANIIRRGACL